MTGRDYLVPAALYALALLVYIAAALFIPGPVTADAAFYASAAERIVHGTLSVDFLWSFNEVGAVIPADPQLPVPIGGHWLPGAAVVAAPLIALFGTAWPIPALGAMLIGALAAPVAWRLALDLGQSPRLALAPGLTVAVGGGALPFLAQPDNHAISLGLGSLGLLMAGRAALGSGRALVAAGLATGALMLVRNDGLLYLLPLAVAAWLGRGVLPRRSIIGAALAVGAIVGPWWLHQLLVFGTLSPSAAGGRSLWIISLEEFNSLGQLTPADLLAHGLPAILSSRLKGLWDATLLHALFFAVGGVLLPFAVERAIALRRERPLVPTLVFAAAFFAAAVLVFSPHVANGMYLRSGAALLPATVVLGITGLRLFLRRVLPAGRRRAAVGAAVAVVIFLQLGLAGFSLSATVPAWSARAAQWTWVSDQLETLATPGDRLATYDAAAAWWHTGYPAVVTPNGDADQLLDVATAYGLKWLVVMRGETVPATQPLLEGARPPWLDPPAAQLTGSDGQTKVAIFRIIQP